MNDTLYAFTMRFPDDLACSKKNEARIRQRGSKRWIGPSDKCKDAQESIRLRATLERHKGFGTDEVRLEFDWHVNRKRCDVRVTSLGPKPKRGVKSGRSRDVINMVAVIADALEGVVFDNDAAVKECLIRRICDDA